MDERDPDADEHQRDGEQPEPEDPGEQRVQAAAEWTGKVEERGQGEQQAADDEADADELVLAAADALAQLGGRSVTT